MLNKKEEYKKMSIVEQSHWWYKILHKLVLDSLIQNIPSKDSKILDAGCGSGGLINYLNLCEYKIVQGFDLSDYAVSISKDKKLNVVYGDIKNIESVVSSQHFDAIISNDTMYFLKMDEIKQFLESCAKLLNPDGIVILNIPVFESFKGIHDISVGIRKRFSRSDLNIFINNKDFAVEKRIFWPFFLSPLIFFVRFVQRIKLIFFKPKIKSDVNLPNSLINNFLYKITLFEVNNITYPFFGSSFFVVLKKI